MSRDIVVFLPIERDAWEQSAHWPAMRKEILEELSRQMYHTAAHLAMQDGLEPHEMRLNTKPASEADELELLGEDVRADPAAYILLYSRWKTRPAPAPSG